MSIRNDRKRRRSAVLAIVGAIATFLTFPMTAKRSRA
jgi:hypothetical protein